MRTFSSRVGVTLAVSLVCGLAASAHAQVQWRSGGEVPMPVIQDVAGELAKLAATGDRRVVVEFARAVTPGERAALGRSGLVLGSYLSGNAYFATLRAGELDAGRAGQLVPVVHVGEINARWKLDPSLWRGEIPFYAIVATSDPNNERVSVDNPIVGTYVMLHQDVSNDEAIAAMVAEHGGRIKSSVVSINAIVVELPFDQIRALAARDAVMWIEPPIVLGPVNDSNRARTGADIVQAPPYGLDGTGVIAFIFDAGRASAHPDIASRLTNLPGDTSGVIDHATHVSGTVGGNGTNNATFKGMAPNVSLVTAGFQWSSGDGFLYSDPGDIELDYTNAINNHNVDIANNSIGNNTEPNGFPCDRQGNYGVTDVLIDTIVRGGVSDDGSPFRIVWANGNERQGSRCDVEGFGDYYSIAPPAGAKNHLAIGALNSNDDSVTFFTSWGPTDDGRMKPDFSAPGCQSNGDGGVTSTIPGGGYAAFCGTSMASPTVCGLSCLLLEDYRAQFPGRPDPRNSTLKVLFAQSALDVRQVGPDYETGYGSVRIQPCIDFMRTNNFFESEVDHAGTAIASVIVSEGAPELRVTLAWDDPPGTPNVNPALVNQLDLVVLDPLGNQAFPWTLDPLNPGAPAVRTAANTRDNLEQVYVPNPTPGVWRVEIRGVNVPQGPQPFSICGSPSLRQKGVAIAVETDIPSILGPGEALDVDLTITALDDSIVPGSTNMLYRNDGGTYASVALTSNGGTSYSANIPAQGCGDVPEFYFTAAGVETGASFAGSADNPFDPKVGTVMLDTTDPCEASVGWSLFLPGDTAARGRWGIADPEGNAAEPADDHSPDGVKCFHTGIFNSGGGGGGGNEDVDAGFVSLRTPAFDLSDEPDAEMGYWRWFSNDKGGNPQQDKFEVYVSGDDGATYVLVETVGPTGVEAMGGWFHHRFRVADFVDPSSVVRVKFVAYDNNPDSFVEAAVDDIETYRVGCEACRVDLTGEGTLNVFDFLLFQTYFANEDPRADFAAPIGVFNVFDFLQFQTEFSEGCP